jgi:DNA-binding LytR/AlgR family response regulator
MNSITTPHAPLPTLALLRGRVHVLIADIVRLEGDGNYTHFILTDGRKILTFKSIGFYESLLPGTFLRVNKPFLLNRFYIKAFSKLEVEMNDGFVAPIARRKRGLLKNTAQC